MTIKKNLTEEMEKDIKTCKGLIKQFFKEVDWIPIKTQNSNRNMNPNLIEYFSQIEKGKWLDENKKRFGVALEKALIYYSVYSQVFEREGEKYKIDIDYTVHSETRLFSVIKAEDPFFKRQDHPRNKII